MAINRGSFAKFLWPGMKASFGLAYDTGSDEWKGLYTMETSDKAYEEIVGTSGLGMLAIKPEGQAIDYDTAVQGFTTRYTHATYAMGTTVTREMFEDDQYGILKGSNGATDLGFSVKTTLNTLGAAVYNNATSYIGGDGVSLLNDSHPFAAGGTYDNLSGDTMSEAALEAAKIAIGKWTNDRGLRINVGISELIIPPDLEFDVCRILDSPLRNATANNDANAVKVKGTIPSVTVNNFITGAASWYLKTNCPHGMTAFMRRAPSFDTDGDFDTENAKFKATFRASFGWSDAHGLYGYDT